MPLDPKAVKNFFARGRTPFVKWIEKIEGPSIGLTPGELVDLLQPQIKSIEELKKLVTRLADKIPQLSPVAARPRVESLVLLCVAFVNRISLSTAKDKQTALDCVASIPRCALRNPAILALLRAGVEALKLLPLIETEPAEQVAEELLQEISGKQSKFLRDLESDFAGLQKAFFPKGWEKTRLDKRFSQGLEFYEMVGGNKTLAGPDMEVVADVNDATFSNSEFWEKLRAENRIEDEGTIPLQPLTIRYQALRSISTPPPSDPFPTKTASLLAAEALAEPVLAELGKPDPLTTRPDPGEIENYVQQVVLIAQPVGTPLRDIWLTHLADTPGLDVSTLRLLRSLAYLPDTIEALGERVFRSLPIDRPLPDVLNDLKALMPAYSIKRNDILMEIRNRSEHFTGDDANRLGYLIWIPGLPIPDPNARDCGVSIFVQIQTQLLQSFDDFDKIEFLLYSVGIHRDKPWSVQYAEHLCGYSLENMANQTAALGESARIELLFRLFDGTDGIFMRQDRSALELLGGSIGEYIGKRRGLSEEETAKLKKLGAFIFAEAGFPPDTLTKLLSVFFEFSSTYKDRKVDDRGLADLIQRAFSAGDSPGIRILQSLLFEPKLFPPSITNELRDAQYNAAPADPRAAHNTIAHSGTSSILGVPQGAGTMAQVIDVVALGDETPHEKVIKCLRIGTESGAIVLKDPLSKTAEFAASLGFSWGKAVIENAVDSIIEETKEFRAEAEWTGTKTAELIQSVFADSQVTEHGGLVVVQLQGDAGIKIGIPKADLPDAEKPLWFSMGKIKNITVLAKLLKEGGDESLNAALAHLSLTRAELALVVSKLFVTALLKHNRLFRDLHLGNEGIPIDSQNAIADLFLFDFGGLAKEFPARWIGWLFRAVVQIKSGNWNDLEITLLEACWEANKRSLSTGQKEGVHELVKAIREKSAEFEGDPLQTIVFLLNLTMNSMTLPKPLYLLAESMRKLAREWLPHLDEKGKESLRAEIMPLVMQIWFGKGPGKTPIAEFSSVIESIQVQSMGPAAILESMQSSRDDREWFSDELPQIPKESVKVYVLRDGELTQGILTKEFTLERDRRISVRFDAGQPVYDYNPATVKGYLEYADPSGTIKRILLAGLVE